MGMDTVCFMPSESGSSDESGSKSPGDIATFLGDLLNGFDFVAARLQVIDLLESDYIRIQLIDGVKEISTILRRLSRKNIPGNNSHLN
mgnify:FL=1